MNRTAPHRRVKRILCAALGLLALAFALSACSQAPNSNTTEHAEANAGINILLSNQGVPIFTSSEYRWELAEIEAIQALGIPTTTFFFPENAVITAGSGGTLHSSVPPFKSCPSVGEPVPNTASLTNPQQKVNNADAVVGQMDPNGGYAPTSSSGTYVLCDAANGQPRMSYWEGPVETESGTAVWDTTSGTVQDIGPAALPVCTLVTSHGEYQIPKGAKYYNCVRADGRTLGPDGQPVSTKALVRGNRTRYGLFA